MISNLANKLQPYTLTILRITTGFMFFQHGLQKYGFLEGRIREFPELTWFAAVMEVLGAPLIMLGLFTRSVSFLLSGQMAVAYFISHAPRDFWPVLNGGEHTALFCFIFLLLATTGPGKLSLDRWICKKR